MEGRKEPILGKPDLGCGLLSTDGKNLGALGHGLNCSLIIEPYRSLGTPTMGLCLWRSPGEGTSHNAARKLRLNIKSNVF